MKEHTDDIRSRKFILIPFCLICQGFQAQGIVKQYPAIIKPILQILIDHDINIIQMPCPEATFQEIDKNLKRTPKSFKFYNTPKFTEHCDKLTDEMVKIIKSLTTNNYKIIAILGIEYSPSCAINYQFLRGTVRKEGIFINSLRDKLLDKEIIIPFIGINKRGTRKAEQQIKTLINKK